MPELCSSLIDTTFRTYVSVSSCRSGWTLTHSSTTVLFLPSHWNTYSFKCKVFKNPSWRNPQMPHSAIGRDRVMILFTCRLPFGLPSVRYLSLSYFDTIVDNLRASFFILSVGFSQPSTVHVHVVALNVSRFVLAACSLRSLDRFMYFVLNF